jgi:translation initiation factor 5
MLRLQNNSSSASDEAGEDDWAPEGDDGVAPVAAVMQGQMAKLTMNADLDKPESQRLDMLERFFEHAKEENMCADSKALLLEAERLELKSKATLLLCNLLFDKDILTQIKPHRELFIRFTQNDSKVR